MNKRQKKKLLRRCNKKHYRDFKAMKWYDIEAFIVQLRNEKYRRFQQMTRDKLSNAFKKILHETSFVIADTPNASGYDRNHRKFEFMEEKIKEFEKALSNKPSESVTVPDSMLDPEIIPSMSIRMVGDKIHSFSIDEDSFKNGYKPGELAQRVPVPRFTNPHKSMPSFDISSMVGFMGDVAIDDEDAFKSVDVTIEHGDTDRMRRQIKYPDPDTTVETTISDDGDTRVDVIKREGEPDLRLVYQGLNEDEPDPVVMSESRAKELKELRAVSNELKQIAKDNPIPDDVIRSRHLTNDEVRGVLCEPIQNISDFAATIPGIKPIDESKIMIQILHKRGETMPINIDGNLDTLIDYHKKVAGNSCEASALD